MPDTHAADTMLSTHPGLPARLRDLSLRAKAQLDRAPALARQQWDHLPERLVATLERLKVRVRDGLEIPSRQDLADLADRIEAVDARLAKLAARPIPRPATVKAPEAAAVMPATAPAAEAKAPAESKKAKKSPPAAAKTAKAPKKAKKSAAPNKKPTPKRPK
ncbi:MAG TPA: hypothetical protein VFG83_14740 [Kofleriaceae bacterium]|nr:hypothetical protein [Kofleriaceae bacterium]